MSTGQPSPGGADQSAGVAPSERRNPPPSASQSVTLGFRSPPPWGFRPRSHRPTENREYPFLRSGGLQRLLFSPGGGRRPRSICRTILLRPGEHARAVCATSPDSPHGPLRRERPSRERGLGLYPRAIHRRAPSLEQERVPPPHVPAAGAFSGRRPPR